jgi:type VI secretion system protein ImpH
VFPPDAKHIEYGWKGTASVRDWLYAEPWEFDFFQAVRLLEAISPERMALGDASNPEEEAVRLSSRVSLEFPASELQSLKASPDSRHPPTLVTNLLGLAGSGGPLPTPDTEALLARSWYGDHAFRDFLDLFQHRLLSLLVKVRKKHHPVLTTAGPDQGPLAECLYACFGMASTAMRKRLQVPDRALLFYSGILSQQPRPASGLERILSDYFRTGARVRQLVGLWRRLDTAQLTVLGVAGRNRRLGSSALLGTRVWDQQGRFEVHLGPMSLRQLKDFLPIGAGYLPLCELTSYYAPQTLEFGFRFTLRAAEVPGAYLCTPIQARLGQPNSRLGWTSWLRTQPAADDDSQLFLRPGQRPQMDTLHAQPYEHTLTA